MLRKLILTFSLGAFAVAVNAQVAVSYMTADEAVQTLLGPNIIYSNPQFSGDALQLGYMSGAVNPFEIPSGIVLGTADIEVINPNGTGGGFINGIDGSPDLLAVANSVPPLIGQSFTVSSINDVATLEFDFVANGTELNFDFIFASNEYLTFVNTQYNDAFGFFLSGPGITGPYSSPAGFPDGAINIAVIPDSDPSLPVTISSVNPGLNSNYYIDNPQQSVIAMNGYTKTLTAIAPLICGETYHIRLSIGDGVDTALDSMVFLEEGSFSIGGQLIQPIVVNPVPNFPPFTVLEGCVQGQFVITPPSCIIEELVLDITIGGTATLGIDYTTNLTDQIVFEPGDPPLTVDITPLVDIFQEDLETITISFDYIGLDGQPATASATLNLIDYQDPTIADMPDTFICPNTNEQVTAQALDGYPPYSYEWSSGQMTATATFSEGDAGEYDVVVTDACGNSGTNSVLILEPEEPFVTNIDTIYVCVGDDIGPLVSGGVLPYTYSLANQADTIYIKPTNTEANFTH
ncbi:MAG: choice-of-anchor L domain-containing protein [Flavobacteriales bacterium]